MAFNLTMRQVTAIVPILKVKKLRHGEGKRLCSPTALCGDGVCTRDRVTPELMFSLTASMFGSFQSLSSICCFLSIIAFSMSVCYWTGTPWLPCVWFIIKTF